MSGKKVEGNAGRRCGSVALLGVDLSRPLAVETLSPSAQRGHRCVCILSAVSRLSTVQQHGRTIVSRQQLLYHRLKRPRVLSFDMRRVVQVVRE